MFLTKMSKRDLIAAAAVLIAALFLLLLPLFWKKEGEILVITTPDGTHEYSLSKDQEIEVSSHGIRLTVAIRDGSARVTASTCPDGVCMSSGNLSKNGDTAVCAPAGVRLMVKGGDGDVDFVAG